MRLPLVGRDRGRIDVGLAHARERRAGRNRHVVAVAGIGARTADQPDRSREVTRQHLAVPLEAAGRQHDAAARGS